MANEAWEPFMRLQQRIKEVTEPLGLEMINWAVMPGSDPLEPKGCSIVFSIDERAFLSPEQQADDEMFEKIAQEERLREIEAQRQKIVQESLKVTRDGILNEDDTPGK